MHHSLLIAACAAASLSLACGTTGQREIRYPFFASGRAPAPFTAGDWQATLDVARVGFGPVYFCATAGASSDLCPAAVAEFADSAVVNGLNPSAQPIGEIDGVTGQINSATYDYAFTWLDTQSAAQPTSAAPGGHSAHFEGHAVRGSTTLRFVADIDVKPNIQGTRSVQGARVTADVQSDQVRLDVRMDPSAWWAKADFNELAALGGDPVVVPQGSRTYNAVVLGMTAAAPPSFQWSGP